MKDKIMETRDVVQTKMNIPYTKDINIRRNNLLEKLSGYFDYRVVLVSAPAGFGKTNLLAAWLNNGFKEKVFTSWISLDEYDNYPELFWNYVLMSLSVNIPEIKKLIETTTSAYSHDGGLSIHLISRVINEIVKINEKVLLILDDFHFINHQLILQGVKFLIKNMPYNMHLVISSRVMPDIGLARLRAADSVLEITQSELRFSMEECNDFINKSIETKLDLEDIMQIERDTEGWVAALQMASLYLKNNKSNIIRENFNNSNLMFDYLSEEVFLSLLPEIRHFLMCTSILEEMSSLICNYLLEITNSREIIEDIDKKNLFLIRLNMKGDCYRYHNLFKTFLRARLEMERADIIPALLSKAGDWYAAEGQSIKAVTYYIDGESYVKAISLIESVSGSLLWKGQASQLACLNSRLPKNLVDNNPRLLLNNAWGSLARGEINKISENINRAEAFLREQNSGEYISREQLGEMAILRSSSFLGTKDLDNIITSSMTAIQYFEKNDMMIQLIYLGIALAYLLKGEVEKAKEYYERIVYASMESNISYTMIIANRTLTTIRRWFGEYSLAEKECLEIIKQLNADSSYPLLGLTYACLADLYLLKNDINKAMEMAKKGLELGNIGEDLWVISENNIVIAQIYYALGLEKEAYDILNKAEHGINYEGFLDSMLKLESGRARILIRNGKFKEVDAWIERVTPLIEEHPIHIYPQVVFVKTSLLIAKKQYDDALRLLDLMMTYTSKIKGIAAGILLQQAIIYYELGDIKKAKENIFKVLNVYKENRIVRPFLIEETAVKKLLKLVKNEIALSSDKTLKEYIEYMDYILSCFEAKSINYDKKDEEILSSREIEIIALIEKGFSNSDISQKLFVSINTVKTHLLNIYTKLDVHSRTSAVSKAREMGILIN